jgi:hypothetical protein
MASRYIWHSIPEDQTDGHELSPSYKYKNKGSNLRSLRDKSSQIVLAFPPFNMNNNGKKKNLSRNRAESSRTLLFLPLFPLLTWRCSVCTWRTQMVAVIKKSNYQGKALSSIDFIQVKNYSILFFISEKYELQEQSLEPETFKNQTWQECAKKRSNFSVLVVQYCCW